MLRRLGLCLAVLAVVACALVSEGHLEARMRPTSAYESMQMRWISALESRGIGFVPVASAVGIRTGQDAVIQAEKEFGDLLAHASDVEAQLGYATDFNYRKSDDLIIKDRLVWAVHFSGVEMSTFGARRDTTTSSTADVLVDANSGQALELLSGGDE